MNPPSVMIPPASEPTGQTSSSTTSNSTTPNSATPSIGATLAVAPPANTSSGPGQLVRPRGHDDKKDGKK